MRGQFSSKFAVIAATVGSAVGLGNIWRFPYELGMNGGFAFLIIYLICALLLGMPVMLSEFIIGRRAGANACGAFRKLASGGKWHLVGGLGVLTAFVILGFYFVVAGWSLEYVLQAVMNRFEGQTSAELSQAFTAFSTSTFRPIILSTFFCILTASVILAGVHKGIEAASKILMPLFFVLILVLCVRSLTLPGAMGGVEFLFKPDFSKLSSSVILSALGQSFFSLSVGMGCLITYASYFKRQNNLVRTAVEVTLLDTLLSVLASVAIFPAVFALGINPAQGPELVFITLPNVFSHIPGGYFWAIIFFVLLAVAALTSTISLFEVITAFLNEEFFISRKKAVVLIGGVLVVLAAVCSLSLGGEEAWTVFGRSWFEVFESLSSKVMLPVGGFLTSLFVGWVLGEKVVASELRVGSRVGDYFISALIVMLRWVVPFIIFVIFLNQIGIF